MGPTLSPEKIPISLSDSPPREQSADMFLDSLGRDYNIETFKMETVGLLREVVSMNSTLMKRIDDLEAQIEMLKKQCRTSNKTSIVKKRITLSSLNQCKETLEFLLDKAKEESSLQTQKGGYQLRLDSMLLLIRYYTIH